MNSLRSLDIKYVKGVGPKRAELLETQLGIRTAYDLVHHFPTHYLDRSSVYRIKDFAGDMPAVQVRGRFVSFNTVGEGAKMRLVGLFSDGTKAMDVVWFKGVATLKRNLLTDTEYVLFGKPTVFNGRWQMTHPEIENPGSALAASGIRGIYPLTETLRTRNIGSRHFQLWIQTLLESHATLRETLPPSVLRSLGLLSLDTAIRAIHCPPDNATLQAARLRLKFEELFYIQVDMLRRNRKRKGASVGHPMPRVGDAFNTFYAKCLPFELTGAQKRVIKEIRADLVSGRQMNRLVQGDVGSGKTLVAVMAMLIAVDNGMQACLMAPTEILATQHYETISAMLAPAGVSVRLLKGSTRASERKEIHEGLRDGSLKILVGTHAIIEDEVQFRNLGMAVIDEQHRFGVAQRARMWAKSPVPPHVLVMTATPIPRTLAMTVYGDLDVSVIDELPPGRKPVETLLRYDENRMEVNRLLGRELAAGRQVYVVYPLIAENPKLELKSVETGYERICGIFPQYEVCFVHGRMKPEAKEAQMQRFVSGQARILVATTVIEVGVNVPNATVMLIENAERFGLSQLHQLRGRVGRGSDRSYCILVTRQSVGGDTRKRLGIMTQTTDGFLISEADMRLRGPGDMEGTQQSGLAFALNVASLATDGQILNYARQAALRILNAHPELVETPGDDGDRAEGELKISPASVDTLRRELCYRFKKTVDWSQIS